MDNNNVTQPVVKEQKKNGAIFMFGILLFLAGVICVGAYYFLNNSSDEPQQTAPVTTKENVQEEVKEANVEKVTVQTYSALAKDTPVVEDRVASVTLKDSVFVYAGKEYSFGLTDVEKPADECKVERSEDACLAGTGLKDGKPFHVFFFNDPLHNSLFYDVKEYSEPTANVYEFTIEGRPLSLHINDDKSGWLIYPLEG